jgi:ribonucleoside-triphosphate reductase (thioredoxin)
LANYESCCLSEIFLPNVETKKEFLDILNLFYRINKHSLMLKSHHPETQRIIEKNMRMGIGVTGWMECSKEQLGWLDEAYTYLRVFDERYSAFLGVNTSIKLTTIKPSGTLSLLPGVTPGIHPAYSKFMYRRIRVAASHALVEVCKSKGYPVEYLRQIDGSADYGTVVVTFPFKYSEGATVASELTAIDQLMAIKQAQTLWSDNSVSCTVYYRIEELPEIREYLREFYNNNHKTVSFLLHSDHGFDQAPYEEITEEEYNRLSDSVQPVTDILMADFEAGDECAGGMCPVK